ncbi:MAG: cadherin-like beta sandwich domain-containing protein [Clostridiales bacterium]|jgi:tRNA threonylcarbamoyladenosine modification (KEOPS) complex  Pcc1 subunit|nr:cadherin-like beta sandwich domain-containing protein [Clostridiales bacterium]
MKKFFTAGTTLAILAALMILMSLNVTAAPAADLTSLNVNTGGSNLISFSTTTTAYNITINSTDTLNITATASSGGMVTVDTLGKSSGLQTGSASLTINPGEIASGLDRLITVSFQEGSTTKDYTITVHSRFDTAELTSNPTVAVGGAYVSVEGNPTSGYAGQVNVNSGGSIAFSVPNSIISNKGSLKSITPNNFTLSSVGSSMDVLITVTAENGTDMTPIKYKVTRVAAVSNNANLSNLTITPNTGSSGTWNTSFRSTTLSYTYTLPSGSSASSVTVTPTASESGAKITVNGSSISSGSGRSVTVSSTSVTTIKIVVTAPDNVTTQEYTINVTRSNMSSNNYLSALTARANSSSGTVQTLYPGFSSDILEYDVFVANSVSTIYISATREDNSSSVSIEGTSGTSRGISLSTGNNTIDVQVVAANGSIRNYTVRVRRATSSAAKDSDLTNLVMRSGSSGTTEVSLSPSFKSGTTSYTATVADSVASCRFVPTLSSSGTNGARAIVAGYVTASGSVSSSVSLTRNVKNTITIRVMAADCSTYTDYKVDVYRGNGDSSLSALTLRDGSANNISYTPVFKSATTTYQASVANTVTSIAIRPVVNDANATVKVNSTTLTSGNWSSNIALNEGTNNIIIEVTAPDGTKTNYTLQIVRQQKPQANQIKLTIGSNIAVVDGAQKTLDSKPLLYSYNKNSYTMVPVRFVSEQLGAKVDWADATKIVTITMGSKVLTLKINEVKPDIGLDAPAILYTDPVLKAPRTMVPLRYVSEQLGAKVDWDNNAKTVTITR